MTDTTSRHDIWTAEEVIALGAHTDVETAGSVLGLSRTQAYEAVREDRFPVPVVRIGSRHTIVPVAPILDLLHIEPPQRRPAHLLVYDERGGVMGVIDPANVTPIAGAGAAGLTPGGDGTGTRLGALLELVDGAAAGTPAGQPFEDGSSGDLGTTKPKPDRIA